MLRKAGGHDHQPPAFFLRELLVASARITSGKSSAEEALG